MIEQTLFASGRPLLIVPYAGRFETIGRNVLIGWSATRELARAVADALPLIAAADNATVLAIDPRGGLEGHGEVPAADIALHLARHGIKVTAAHTASGGVSPGDVLLNYATDNGTRPAGDRRLRPFARARAGHGRGHPHHPAAHDHPGADVALIARPPAR